MESIILLVSSGRPVRKRILLGASLPDGWAPGTVGGEGEGGKGGG